MVATRRNKLGSTNLRNRLSWKNVIFIVIIIFLVIVFVPLVSDAQEDATTNKSDNIKANTLLTVISRIWQWLISWALLISAVVVLVMLLTCFVIFWIIPQLQSTDAYVSQINLV